MQFTKQSPRKALLRHASFAGLSISYLLVMLTSSAFARPDPATLDWNITKSPDVAWRWCKRIGKGHWWTGAKKQDCTGTQVLVPERLMSTNATYISLGVWCKPSRSTHCEISIKGIWTNPDQSISGAVVWESATLLPGTIKVFNLFSESGDTATFRLLEINDSKANSFRLFP